MINNANWRHKLKRRRNSSKLPDTQSDFFFKVAIHKGLFNQVDNGKRKIMNLTTASSRTLEKPEFFLEAIQAN